MADGESYEGRDLEALSDAPHYYRWIMSWFAPFVHGRVIEYGAGTGTFSAQLRPHAQRLTLVEPSTNLHATLRARFAADKAVEIVGATIEDHLQQQASGTADAAVMVNVLEHIEDDHAALSGLTRVLAPGGHVLIFVPALSLLMSQLDRDLGHFRRYHRKDLSQKMKDVGLDVLTCRYFDFTGVMPWLVINRWMGRTALSPHMLRLYDRAVVPVARVVETAIPPPLGKNLVAIGRI